MEYGFHIPRFYLIYFFQKTICLYKVEWIFFQLILKRIKCILSKNIKKIWLKIKNLLNLN